jgi:hypothetical protein
MALSRSMSFGSGPLRDGPSRKDVSRKSSRTGLGEYERRSGGEGRRCGDGDREGGERFRLPAEIGSASTGSGLGSRMADATSAMVFVVETSRSRSAEL